MGRQHHLCKGTSQIHLTLALQAAQIGIAKHSTHSTEDVYANTAHSFTSCKLVLNHTWWAELLMTMHEWVHLADIGGSNELLEEEDGVTHGTQDVIVSDEAIPPVAPACLAGALHHEQHSWIDVEQRGDDVEVDGPETWRGGSSLPYNAITVWFLNIQHQKPEVLLPRCLCQRAKLEQTNLCSMCGFCDMT